MDIDIPGTDEGLLAQCDVETFRGSGPGGQSVNTADSAVRMIHRPTGVVVVCREQRSQLQNRQACLKRLRARLEALAYVPPERKPTRPSRAAKERRLMGKSHTAHKKRLRRRPIDDE